MTNSVKYTLLAGAAVGVVAGVFVWRKRQSEAPTPQDAAGGAAEAAAIAGSAANPAGRGSGQLAPPSANRGQFAAGRGMGSQASALRNAPSIADVNAMAANKYTVALAVVTAAQQAAARPRR